ncbi:uncharacterized protein [Ptychodera flava]|uniref:uncharacterized protein n=1 Tax=Ptychodera flava TaxID=63121 RepID=UPI00396A53CB
MKCKSLEALECLMSEYSSGRLLKMMEEELLTPEFMKRIGVLYLSLQVLIDMEEYKLCRSELLALNETQKKKPRRNSIASIYEIKLKKPTTTAGSSASEHLHLIVPNQIRGQILGHSLQGSTGIACEQTVTAALQRRTGVYVLSRRYQKLKEQQYRSVGKVMILRGMETDRINERQACETELHAENVTRDSLEESLLLNKTQLMQQVQEGRKTRNAIKEANGIL